MHIRIADPTETALVSGVLSAAAARLRERGQELWTAAEVSELTVAPAVRDGLYHLGMEGAEAVGVFRLQWEDRDFWPEFAAGDAAYLHKLAVVPQRQGRGLAHALLRHAAGLALQKRLRFLRLDCESGRPGLRTVYEGFGFRHHSQKRIGQCSFERFELGLGQA